jgi:hypothetical protein
MTIALAEDQAKPCPNQLRKHFDYCGKTFGTTIACRQTSATANRNARREWGRIPKKKVK